MKTIITLSSKPVSLSRLFFPIGGFATYNRNQFMTIVHRVFERVESSNEERRHATIFADGLNNPPRSRPCLSFRRRKDRAQRQTEPYAPSIARCTCPDPRDSFRGFRQWFSPKRIDIGVPAGDCDRGIGRAAKVNRQVWL